MNLTSERSDKIIIINVENFDRNSIANGIMKLKKHEPKVVGIDILFEGRESFRTDSLLSIAINSPPKTVLSFAESFEKNNVSIYPDSIFFGSKSVVLGLSTCLGLNSGMIVDWQPLMVYNEKNYWHFSYLVASFYDHNKTYSKIEPGSMDEQVPRKILYRRSKREYDIISLKDIDYYSSKYFENKIVLFGYVGTEEDIFLTPMNKYLDMKNIPDTNGVIILANIISELIDD